MPEQLTLQEEIKKVAESIHALESLRGKIPDDQLEQALSAYRQQLRVLIAKLRGKIEADADDSGGRPARIAAGSDILQQLYKSYCQPVGDAALNQNEFVQYLATYLRWLDKTYSNTHLTGLDTLSEDGGNVTSPLREVYVQPTLRCLTTEQKKEIDNRSGSQVDKVDRSRIYLMYADNSNVKGELVLLPALLNHSENIAIIGSAGSGKSSLLAYLASNLASNILTGRLLPFGIPENRTTLIPIIVPCRYYWKYLSSFETNPGGKETDSKSNQPVSQEIKPSAPEDDGDSLILEDINVSETGEEPQPVQNQVLLDGTLAGFISEHIRQSSPELAGANDFFHRLLLSGSCLLMLDGLDELFERKQRERIRKDIENLVQLFYPGNIVIVTARAGGVYEDDEIGPLFSHFYIQGLSDKQTENFVANWCRRLNPRKAALFVDDISQAIERINQEQIECKRPPFINTPLMVSLMICTRLVAAEWPQSRLKIFELFVKMLLKSKWINEDAVYKEETTWAASHDKELECLAVLAVKIHKGGYERAYISADRVKEFIADELPEENKARLLNALRLRGVLVQERFELFGFCHIALQEYMAALGVVKQNKAAFENLELEASNPWWRQVLTMVYQIAQYANSPFALEFMEWLANLHLAGLELAGAILIETEAPKPEVRASIVKRLIASIEDKNVGALPIQRAQAGKTLARLGDSRFREDIWLLPNEDLLGFVRIPGGKYLIGSNPDRDHEATSKEVPMHEVGMLTYYLARYPVTIGQFRLFAQDARYTPTDPESLYGLPNYPVVNVTWDDAIAYTRWIKWHLSNWQGIPDELGDLLKTGDWDVTLPSEPEWECAAHGPSSRPYPWGTSFDPKFANTEEANIGEASAVGCFPGGASPYKILDLSGNVWEWTRSVYRIYYYRSDDGREDHESRDFRVLRGGSFLNRRLYARCTYRNMYYPDYKGNNIGFRLAIHQTHEYEEREVEMDVPAYEIEAEDPLLAKTADENGMVKVKRRVTVRKPVIIAGPRQDR